MGEKPLFRKKKSSAMIIILSLILVSMLGFLGYLVKNKLEELKTKTGFDPKKLISQAGTVAFRDKNTGEVKDNIVILVIGLDENRDDRGILHHKGSRTDTIFLLGLDKNANRMGLLSIPRDTWIRISDKHGENKINTAYTEGFWDVYKSSGYNYEKAKAAGIAQAMKTVSEFTDVPIDHYVLLKIRAAPKIVDALGGLNIDVEKNMDYVDNWGNLNIHLKKGSQLLKGKDVVGYARFRHDEEGDWGRIRRQHQVINALIRELKKPQNIAKIDQLAVIVKENLETDFDINDLVDLAKVYKDFKPDHITKGVIVGEDKVISGCMSVIPDKKIKDRLVARIIKNPSYVDIKDQWVQVLNGCGVVGLGGKTADRLKDIGYNIVEVGNIDNAKEDDNEETTIIDYYINPEGVDTLKKMLGLKNVKVVRGRWKSNDTTLDFTVVVGKDMKAVLSGENPDAMKKANN
jgi:polyisoprenyl-teichoic acid--peptidoglycan teichoic acid transferase